MVVTGGVGMPFMITVRAGDFAFVPIVASLDVYYAVFERQHVRIWH